MMMKWIRQRLILLCIVALLFSMVWTYISLKSIPAIEPPKEVSLTIVPDYRVITGKALLTWPTGTVFDPGLAAYFYAAAPSLYVTPTVQISGLEQGLASGFIQSEVSIQAVDDKSRIYWSYPLKEIRPQLFTLSQNVPGQADQIRFKAAGEPIEISEAYASVTQISDELTFYNGLFQLIITSRVHLSGTVNGIPVEKDLVQVLPVTLQQVSFSIPVPKDVSSQVSLTPNLHKVSQQSLMDAVQQNPLLFMLDLVLILSLLLLLIMKYKTREKTAVDHRRYREWITEGIVDVRDKLIINILSLEGLVDLAIDLDKRVIFDSRVQRYYVLTEDLVYGYDPAHSQALLENRQQLGKLLLDRGLIRPEQLEIGLYYQKKIGRRLGDSLTALGFIDETTLYSTLAAQQETDYYELDAMKDMTDISWLERMNIQKARAMMVLPLGKRADEKLTVACSEFAREGLQEALEELFGAEVYMVAARPSAIYQALERLETMEKEKKSLSADADENETPPIEPLTEKEKEQFTASYTRGQLLHEILLKASGFVDTNILRQVPEQEALLPYLVNRNSIPGEIVNLMKGLDKAIEAMDWKSRQQKRIPGFIDLLLKSNYLAANTVEWAHRELALQDLPLDRLLLKNFIASENTVKNAGLLLRTLGSILGQSGL